MDLTTKQRVTEALNLWLVDPNNPGRSLNGLATDINENLMYVSKIKNGEYEIPQKDKKPTVIKDHFFTKIAAAIGLELRTAFHFDTVNFNGAIRAIRYAQRFKRRVLLTSEDSGLSKTYTLEWAAKNLPNMLYCKITSNMRGKDLIDLLIRQLGIKTDAKRAAVKMDLIAEKILTADFCMLLDEVEAMAPDMWRVIKDLSDRLDKKCGLLLCGMGLDEELKRGASRGRKLMPQLWRRFRGTVVKMKNFSKKDVECACQLVGVTDAKSRAYINENVHDMGMLREWMEDIYDLLISQGKPVTGEALKELFDLNIEDHA